MIASVPAEEERQQPPPPPPRTEPPMMPDGAAKHWGHQAAGNHLPVLAERIDEECTKEESPRAVEQTPVMGHTPSEAQATHALVMGHAPSEFQAMGHLLSEVRASQAVANHRGEATQVADRNQQDGAYSGTMSSHQREEKIEAQQRASSAARSTIVGLFNRSATGPARMSRAETGLYIPRELRNGQTALWSEDFGPSSRHVNFIEEPDTKWRGLSRFLSTASRKKSKPCVLTADEQRRLTGLRDLHNATCVINPDTNRTLAKWDILAVLALGFVAIFTPAEVALMEVKWNPIFVINRLVDLIFIVDMCLQFFIMYPVFSRFGRQLEYRRDKIAKNYLTGWFLIDFASILPVDMVAMLAGSHNTFLSSIKLVKVVRLLRLLKLLRVLKTSKTVKRIEVRLALTYQTMNLVKFFAVLMMMGHWMACLWAMTLRLVDADEPVPRWIDTLERLENEPYIVSPKTKDSLAKIYLTSAYVASYTITGIGDGDLPPVNTSERAVRVFMEYAAGIIWAYVIGQVCSIIYRMESIENEFRNVMDDLNYMMEDRALPTVLRRRLRSFFLAAKQARRHEGQKALLKKMSPALQGEVAFCSNEKWLAELTFFKNFPIAPDPTDPLSQAPKVVVDIAVSLEVQVYSQMERFGVAGVLYIQKAGLTSRLGRVFRSGAVWGLDFILTERELMNPLISFCLTFVECSLLKRDTFLDIIKEHQDTFPELAQTVRKHIVYLAVCRGIINEARRRRVQQVRERRINHIDSADHSADNRSQIAGLAVERATKTWSCGQKPPESLRDAASTEARPRTRATHYGGPL